MASGTIIKSIKDFAKQVNANGIQLKKVILFGSYANDKQTKYSD